MRLISIFILFCIFLSCKKTENKIGKFPLCEPSAAITINCPNNNNDTCLIVGDNEVKNKLFYFPISQNKLKSEDQNTLKFDGFKIQDIEAIAKIDKKRFVIFGSHSRNKKCKIKKKRLRFAQVQITGNRLELIGEVVQTKKISSENLFDPTLDIDKKLLKKVKKAIDDSERAADSAKGSTSECKNANSFNIEAAAFIQDRVWIGLRSPLVSWNRKRYAILLRLKNLEELKFDGIALVDTDQKGIRELSPKGDYLFGISGGPEDGKDNFSLWGLPIPPIQTDTLQTPKTLKKLPKSSEGLALTDSKIFVVIDGDKGKADLKCKKAGKYLQIELNE